MFKESVPGMLLVWFYNNLFSVHLHLHQIIINIPNIVLLFLLSIIFTELPTEVYT